MTEYYNPNQPDPNVHKRLLLAFALVFVILGLSQWFLVRPVPPAQPATPAETAAQPAPAASPALGQPSPAAQVAASPQETAPRQAEAEQQVVVENEFYRITFSNRGAVATSWILKKHSDDRGNPLDIIHPYAADQHGLPLELWTYDPELRQRMNQALYVSDAEGQLHAPAALTFEYAEGGLRVRKSFRFDDSYVIQMETEAYRDGVLVQAYPAWPAGFGDQTVPASYTHSSIVLRGATEVQREWVKDVSGGNTITNFHWGGVSSQYFAAVFLPEIPQQAAIVTLRHAVQVPQNLNRPDPNQQQTVEVLGAAVGNQFGPTRQRMFVGPKALEVLQSVQSASLDGRQPEAGPDLENLVDFGFFGIIARPLFLWLKWTHDSWVANWGVAIIILTVFINVALFPLRYAGMKSMLKMQKIAPQMKAIRDRYSKYKATDPRKREEQKEIAALMKQHGANPIGGCLPLLLQLPFFIAFYTMLGAGVELRHATFLWIPDLSAPDPYYLIPLFIGVSMFLMQRITPQGGMDPMQQKMMLVMMPIFLSAISITLASGLTLYWAMGNVVGFVQQLWMNNTAFGREVREEMAKRAAKKKA